MFTALVTLVTLVGLSMVTALKFDFNVRIRNRESGGWINGHNGPGYAPIVVEEKSASSLGVWRIDDGGEETNVVFNQATGLPVVVTDTGHPLATLKSLLPAARVLLEVVDVSAYRIKDIETELYWTREGREVFLRRPNSIDDHQIWEFRPQGFDEEFAFWE
ncbi:hypothetical protein DFQ26_009785 [Actinomortierella ambigua]|nr:hypothetical protein DFQ26_009785 [Actinomortierella ambigua]